GVNIEGPVSALVPDSSKYQCSNCNGVKFSVSKTLDDFNDVVQATVEAALDITAAGAPILGEVALCLQCGNEQILWWMILDTVVATGAALVMTNLDAGTANTLAGYYAIPTTGTLFAATKYDTIASHTAAAPTTLTLDTGSDNSEDGIWVITNRLPTGWTLAS
ncbi:hypothetical protein LCGC14_2613710, partial [marine sediment metagenome]